MIDWLHYHYERLQGRVDPDQLPLSRSTQNSFMLQYGVIVEKPEGLDER